MSLVNENHIDMTEIKTEIVKELEKEHHIILSTTIHNKVRSRLVDFVNHELEIGFFSWISTRKIHDMVNNSQVALCVNNLQIEGRATIYIERVDKCKTLFELYQQKLPKIYEKFRKLPDTCFVTIEPTLLIMMKYEHDSLFLYHVDVVHEKAYRKKLSDW
jgi:general stress protein 26